MGLMPSTWKATVRIKHFSSHAWYVVGKEELEGRGNDGVCDSHSLSRGNIKNSHLEITEKPVTRQALFLCTVNIKFSVPRGSQSRCTPAGVLKLLSAWLPGSCSKTLNVVKVWSPGCREQIWRVRGSAEAGVRRCQICPAFYKSSLVSVLRPA